MKKLIKFFKKLFGIKIWDKPVAFDIEIKGEASIGGTLIGFYSFSSPNSYPEGQTGRSWQISFFPFGTEVLFSGQTISGDILQITKEMAGKYVWYRVIPQSHPGHYGEEAFSKCMKIPAT